MPRVKVDYIVSFSSESPDAPASNLLASDAGQGRWLCARGEPSCSVLLQLSKAVQISSITIGAHLSALVEVLVGRSETPNDQYKVLVASSVFLSPLESRKAVEGDPGGDRVRTFSGDQLGEEVREGRWDRVRVQCSQPYNKHCKYGLSFIHIFSPEADSEPAPKPVRTKAALKMQLELSPQDSDDDDLKPGALFAQHRAKQSQEGAGSSTDAQIRQATSQALKHQSDTSAKIVRTPISKPKGSAPTEASRSDRHRDSLLYTDEDTPHDKIDRVVSAHKDMQAKAAEKSKEEKDKRRKDKDKDRQSSKDKQDTEPSKRKERAREESTHSTTPKDKNRNTDKRTTSADHPSKHSSGSDSLKKDKHDGDRRDKDRNRTPQSSRRDRSSSSKQDKDESSSKKKKVSKEDSGETLEPGPVSQEPHTLLSDVVFVLSGYENPRRAKVRDAALAMGATFQRDWGPTCTHLICAFPNTPKLRSVRSSPDGDRAIVVTAEWIERCAVRQRRLPWQWFATEQKYRVQRARSASGENPPGSSGTSGNPGTSKDRESGDKEDSPNKTAVLDSDCDTDDDIERVMQTNAKKRKHKRLSSTEREESPSKKEKKEDTTNTSRESDVAFVKDERVQGNVTVSDSDSDATDKMEDTVEDTPDISSIDALPPFFEGCTFAVHRSQKPALDERLIRRYVTAYGGEIVEPQEDEEIEVDYVLCLSNNTSDVSKTDAIRGRMVRGDWIWKCHERRKLCSPREFLIAC